MSRRSDPFATYREEALELLTELENALLSLESNPHDGDTVNAAFRALHTIKGSGAMLDLAVLVGFAHHLENVFDLLRSGIVGVTKEIIEIALAAKDELNRMVLAGRDAEESEASREILSRITAAVPETISNDAETKGGTPASAGLPGVPRGDGPGDSDPGEPRRQRCFQVHYAPDPRDFLNGGNPLLILQEISGLGEALVLSTVRDVPPLSDLEAERCYLAWEILVCTNAGENAIHDIFMFVGNDAEVEVAEVDKGASAHDVIMSTRIGELLLHRGLVTPSDVDSALTGGGPIGEALVAAGCVTGSDVIHALREQELRREAADTDQDQRINRSIKVATEKLDGLVDLVGEFVSTQSGLLLHAAGTGDTALRGLAERLEDQVRRLRELSMEMHLVPIDTLFAGFRRVVRDLSAQLNKRIHLQIEGAETELDKNIVEALRDPLMHLVRNAADHGIENPADREHAGKDPVGTLTLGARHVGSTVEIEVRDDGRGLDVDAVRRRAIEKGLIDPEEALTPEQITDLIFQPGFSTAAETTNVSGRGVGMDVVRKNVERVGGSVRLGPGEQGGTTATLRIPLTMAIVDGVLAQVGGNFYFANIAHVLECLDAEAFGAGNTFGVIDLRGEILPYYDLRDFFDLPRPEDGSSQVLVVQNDDARLGLVVDRVQDNYQSVIKPLGRLFDGLEGISGAIILGDGTPALMLDVDRLIRVTRAEIERA
jgi:two-component system, chemotaxis family, sensor kinase CheA